MNFSDKLSILFDFTAVLFTLLSSWGDPSCIGLTGLELLDSTHTPIPLSPSQLTLSPSGENKGLETLLDGENMVTSPHHMWCVSSADKVTIEIGLDVPHQIGGVMIWNYNKSPEDSYIGVSNILISMLT